MEITDIVSAEFTEFSTETPVSKLVGAFEDPTLEGIVVRDGEEFAGVVTRRQLVGSSYPPDQKAGSFVRQVPRLTQHDDVREVARLVIESGSRVLPVFEGRELLGVVTVDGLLAAVQPYLNAATVREAYTEDLVTVGPETTFGEALHTMRDRRITHLPVVEGTDPLGMVSVHDVTRLAVRSIARSQGGDSSGFGNQGGPSQGDSRGGFGAREGERARMLDLPVRDLMTAPVRTITLDRTLEDAVAEMFDIDASALLVVDADGEPSGIVTKTDALRALTWEAGGNRGVQVLGVDLLDDISYDEVVEMVDRLEKMDAETRVLDAKVHLHEHDEKLRGTPLILARLRLHTDRGLLTASGEGYGASNAIHEARDVLERRIRDDKTYGRNKKHPDAEYWERRFGWWLEG